MGDLTTFDKRLREARLKAELTQAELAKKANTTAATISSYENDKGVKKASLDIAINLAKILNVSLDWLCGLDVDKNKVAAIVNALHAKYWRNKSMNDEKLNLNEIAGKTTNFVKTLSRSTEVTSILTSYDHLNMHFTCDGTEYVLAIHEEPRNADQS